MPRQRVETPDWALVAAFWIEYENLHNEVEHLNGERILATAQALVKNEKDDERMLNNLDD